MNEKKETSASGFLLRTCTYVVFFTFLFGFIQLDSSMSLKTEFSKTDLLLSRRSIRVMSGEVVKPEELEALLEAARWAPSEFNNQPWRFLYAQQGDDNWATYFSLLDNGNQKWACKASVLMVVLTNKHMDYNNYLARTHWFDAGASCQNMALRAHELGLAFCCIGGFDVRKTRKQLGIPRQFDIPVMIAIGRPRPGLPPIKGHRKEMTMLCSSGGFPAQWLPVTCEGSSAKKEDIGENR